MNTRDTKETRRRLLKAAAQVIREQGVRQLTLEAVAAAAGCSKGGLLYHYPSKEALVGGLVDQGMADFDAAVASRQAAGRDWLSAYAEAAMVPGELDDLGPALVGALSEAPALLESARGSFRRWYAQARKQAGTRGVLALLVLDGLFIHQVFGLDPVLSAAELADFMAASADCPPSPGKESA